MNHYTKHKFIANWACIAFALITAIHFIACSDNAADSSAGIFIETNTGNKASACIYVPTKLWKLSAGDTVSLEQSRRDTIGDTIYITESDYRKVADSTSIASGTLILDSVPEGRYDSVTVYTSDGKTHVFATNIDIDKEQTYYLDTAGVREVTIVENTGTVDFSDVIYLSVKDFGIKAGDSLTFYGHTIWGVENNKLFIFNFEDWNNVMDSKNVATGLAYLYHISYGFCDSIVVKSPDGRRVPQVSLEQSALSVILLLQLGIARRVVGLHQPMHALYLHGGSIGIIIGLRDHTSEVIIFV